MIAASSSSSAQMTSPYRLCRSCVVPPLADLLERSTPTRAYLFACASEYGLERRCNHLVNFRLRRGAADVSLVRLAPKSIENLQAWHGGGCLCSKGSSCFPRRPCASRL